jgi:4-amino-4-deoxy-L-arabinose transferase-like glycosyltransferase
MTQPGDQRSGPDRSADAVPSTAPFGWPAALLLFAVALAARAVYGCWRGGPLAYDDEIWYWEIARAYAAGDGLVGEFGHRAGRMPLYPWMLSWFDSIDSARAMQWVVGGLAAPLTYALARPVTRWAFLAGLIVAFDPTLVGSASLLLSETLAVTVLTALWCVGLRLATGRGSWRQWASAALLASLCVYARESLLVLIAALLLALIVMRRDARTAAGAAGVGLVVLVALLPWAWRNQRVLGQWCWLTTRGGISLYDGVRPGATGASDLAEVKDVPAVRGLSEVEWDAYFRNAAYTAIREEPGRVLGLIPVKWARTWSPMLNAAEYASPGMRIIFALWYVPLYLAVVTGCIVRRRSAATVVLLLLPALCVCALHGVFVGSVRYRLVALPMLAVLAAAGIERAWVWIAARRRDSGRTA